MTDERQKKKHGIVMWVIMGFLILGLGGFGLTGAFQATGGTAVATVGKEEISVDRFYSSYQRDIQVAAQQFGQNITADQARLFGIDQSSLQRQLTLAALSNEASNLGLSVGDVVVRQALLANPAFQTLGTGFSEATYDLVLRQQNLTRAEYESLLRDDQTQNLISGAISGGVAKQDTAARILMDFIGERRDLVWAELDETILTSEIAPPGEAEIQAYYDQNPDAFTTPETRKITYAIISPELLGADIEITDEAIREVFDAQSQANNTPARRIVDRIIFPDMAAANEAYQRLDAGEASFEEIAAEQGQTPEETQIGMVVADRIANSVAELIFASEETGIYGPVQALIGPALYKVNAAFPAVEIAYDDVKDNIRTTLAQQKANAQIQAMVADVEDIIAGGASLEELANESDMQLFTIDFNVDSPEPIASDPLFISEALAADVNEDRDLVELDNGAIIALRVDEIRPARLRTLEESRDQAVAGATQAATARGIQDYARELKSRVESGADFPATLAAAGQTPNIETNATRTSPPTGLPPLVALELFNQNEGDVIVYPSETGAFVVQVTRISPFDPASDTGISFLQQANAQMQEDIASDLYILFANGVLNQTEITLNQGLIEQIVGGEGLRAGNGF